MELKLATFEAVRYACLRFHYAKAVPPQGISYSLFENGEWCGVICYGYSTNRNIGVPYDLAQGEVMELTRVALNGKQSFTSKAVAMSMKQIKKDVPTVRLLVSYADMEQGHVGTIYQATNWYAVEDQKSQAHIMMNGKLIHRRSVSALYGTVKIDVLKKYDPNVKWVKLAPKIKYLFPLDKDLIPMCQKLSIPYKKKNG